MGGRLLLENAVRVIGRGHLRLRFGQLELSGSLVPVAVKQASLDRAAREKRSANAAARLEHEASVYAELQRGRGVLQCYGVREMQEESKDGMIERFVGLVLERADDHVLARQDLLHDLDFVISSLAQASVALKDVHMSNILHRDIKPQNLLVNQAKEIKLSDFDHAKALSAVQSGCEQHELVGTLEYMAPEVLAGGQHSVESDVFSLGLTAAQLLSGGKSLYHGVLAPGVPGSLSRAEFQQGIIRGKIVPDFTHVNRHVPESCHLLLERCLQRDPAERPSLDEMANGFQKALDDWRRGTVTLYQQNKKERPRTSVACALEQGRRRSMEDCALALHLPHGIGAVIGVFDGHGGRTIAENACKTVEGFVLGTKGEMGEHFSAAAIQAAARHVDAMDQSRQQGSTATIVALDKGRGCISLAWVGDSSAYGFHRDHESAWVATPLTQDHRPDLPRETARINAGGGRVERNTRMMDDGMEYPFGPWRVFTNDGKGGLAVSRSLGDTFMGDLLSSDPDVNHLCLSSFPLEYVVVASDGVWDVLDGDALCQMLQARQSAAPTEQDAGWFTNEIVAQALERGSQDNVAAAVLFIGDDSTAAQSA